MNKLYFRFVIVIGAMIMVGCVNPPQSPEPGAVITTPPAPPPAPAENPVLPAPAPEVVTPPAPTTNPAVDSLVKQARTQYLLRDYLNAIATAERGLRIDRRAADLYLVLAQSYLQLALPQKASMFVQQGLRYAPQGSEAAEGLMRVQDIVQQSN